MQDFLLILPKGDQIQRRKAMPCFVSVGVAYDVNRHVSVVACSEMYRDCHTFELTVRAADDEVEKLCPSISFTYHTKSWQSPELTTAQPQHLSHVDQTPSLTFQHVRTAHAFLPSAHQPSVSTLFAPYAHLIVPGTRCHTAYTAAQMTSSTSRSS